MDRIHRMLTGMGGAGGQGGPPGDTPQVDTAEQIYISSLALLKMLKHGTPGSSAAVLGTLPLSVVLPCGSATLWQEEQQARGQTFASSVLSTNVLIASSGRHRLPAPVQLHE